MACGELITSSSAAPSAASYAGWKKHGRTRPSGSSTADTHGALQVTARQVAQAGQRGVVVVDPPQAGDAALDELRDEDVVARALDAAMIAASSSRSSRDSCTSARRSAGHGVGRLKAVELTSAARNDSRSTPSAMHRADGVLERVVVRFLQHRSATSDGQRSAARSARTPRAMRSNPPRTRRIASCGRARRRSRSRPRPSARAIGPAYDSIRRPVVTSVSRMPSLAQPVTERPEVRVQQRLAAGEHHALDVQPAEAPRRGRRARRPRSRASPRWPSRCRTSRSGSCRRCAR